jgi:hypothetical protein
VPLDSPGILRADPDLDLADLCRHQPAGFGSLPARSLLGWLERRRVTTLLMRRLWP